MAEGAGMGHTEAYGGAILPAMKGYTGRVNGTKNEDAMRIGETAYERAKRILAEEPQPSAPRSLVDALLADIDNDRAARDGVPAGPTDAFA